MTAPEFPAETIDRVVRLLINSQDRAAIARVCQAEMHVPADQVDAVLDAASEKLSQAAACHRDLELARAIARLDECYRRAIKDGETSVAIRAQHELNGLLGLGPRSEESESEETDPAAEGAPENQHLADIVGAIEHYLEPLGLSESVHDTDADLIRLAAQEIKRLRRRKRKKPRKRPKPKS